MFSCPPLPSQPASRRVACRLLGTMFLAGLLAGCGMGAEDSGPAEKTGASVGNPAAAAFAITTATLPAGQPGVTYPTTSLAVTNASGAVTWSLDAGTLPTGLTLSGTGVLGGMPATTASPRSPSARPAARSPPRARSVSRSACSAWWRATGSSRATPGPASPSRSPAPARRARSASRSSARTAPAPTRPSTRPSALPAGCRAPWAVGRQRPPARGGHGERGDRDGGVLRPPRPHGRLHGRLRQQRRVVRRSAREGGHPRVHLRSPRRPRHGRAPPGREHLGRRRRAATASPKRACAWRCSST